MMQSTKVNNGVGPFELSKNPEFQIRYLQLTSAKMPRIEFGAGEILIVVVEASRFEEKLSDFFRELSLDERRRLALYSNRELEKKFILYRGILRNLCKELIGNSSYEIIQSDRHKKPFLYINDSHLDLRFNVSHSQETVLYAFSLGREIGVDIEVPKKTRNVTEGVAEMVLTALETAAFREIPTNLQKDAFLRLWTQKEAISKAAGKGVAINFKSLNVGIQKPYWAKIPFGEQTAKICDISHADRYFATVALVMPEL